MHREPDVEFNPRSPGLGPGPEAGAKPLRHPGIPELKFKKRKEKRGAQVAQLVECLTLDLSSGLNLGVVSLSPTLNVQPT